LRFIVDEMLPRKLAEYLIEEGYDASTVKWLKLGPDEMIWEHAEKHGAIVITKDSDYLPFPDDFSAAQLVHFTGENMSTAAMIDLFRQKLPQLIEALKAGDKIVEIR
jgi:predicted nuclease of predicted toxin-antitoxin system